MHAHLGVDVERHRHLRGRRAGEELQRGRDAADGGDVEPQVVEQACFEQGRRRRRARLVAGRERVRAEPTEAPVGGEPLGGKVLEPGEGTPQALLSACASPTLDQQ